MDDIPRGCQILGRGGCGLLIYRGRPVSKHRLRALQPRSRILPLGLPRARVPPIPAKYLVGPNNVDGWVFSGAGIRNFKPQVLTTASSADRLVYAGKNKARCQPCIAVGSGERSAGFTAHAPKATGKVIVQVS